MRQIRDIHESCIQAKRPAISFEFFPPKTDDGDRALFTKTLPALLALRPDYCSVTYGAGGTTREKTIAIVERIQREFSLPTMMHLTCVNATQEDLRAVIEDARSKGVQNILALRGDPPGGTGEWTRTEGGFEFSHQLVTFLRQLGGFTIGTAGFPEGHIACTAGKHTDWDHLCHKIEQGTDFVITQLFFDNEDFYQFHDYIHQRLGRPVTIIPGILPIVAAGQTKKFTQMCGARLPEKFLSRLEKYTDDDAGAAEFGIEYATEQCADLLRFGVPGLHFYTLNKPTSTTRVVQNLGLR